MNLTTLFIRRPVLAISLSLAILLFGIKAIGSMPITEYPPTINTTVDITTHYFGASPKTVTAFVTAPLEKAIGQAPGINYMTADSEEGLSIIQVYMKMGQNPDAALSQIQTKVNSVLNQLPVGVLIPIVQEISGSGADLIYLNYSGKAYNQQQITDYLTRVVQPALESVKGIGLTSILPPGTGPNGNTFSMRIWLNPHEMAVLGVTPSEIDTALKQNDYVAAVGRAKGEYFAVNLTANTAMHKASSFKSLIVAYHDGTPVYLDQVARVVLGAQTYNSSVLLNGKPSVSIGIMAAPGSNSLAVAHGVIAKMNSLKSSMPVGMKGFVLYNGASFISSSIDEVLIDIVIALGIVILVIYGFLGSLRALAIPVIAIPIAMLGAGSIMLALGFTINILTLLAMVLAIGLVVDDSIIVVENVHRHIEGGMTPVDAAILSGKELASPILVMATTIGAVFAPLALLGGLVGTLFGEFALTIVATVALSLVVALTLSPMLASRFLMPGKPGRVAAAIEHGFEALRVAYGRLLRASLKLWPAIVVGAALLALGLVPLFNISKSELAPPADQGIVYVNGIAPPTATLNYMNTYDRYLTSAVFDKIPSKENSFVVNGVGIGGMLLDNEMVSAVVLKPKRGGTTTQQVRAQVQKLAGNVPGMTLSAFGLPPLPGAAVGLPVQFVVTGTGGYHELDASADKIVEAAQKSGLFAYVDKDLKFNNEQVTIHINRKLAASMGFTMADIGDNLDALLGGNDVNYYSMSGLSYRVTPQVPPKLRANPAFLRDYYLRSKSGTLVPISTFVTLQYSPAPDFLPQFQQLNSVTIQANPQQGVSLGQALAFLKTTAAKTLPSTDQIHFGGESRQFVHQGNAFIFTFMFALVVVFLVLSAQFESFRDSLVVLTAVPITLIGAIVPIALGFSTINIYSEVGMIMLMGLVSKQGILIVQFARSIQMERAISKTEAVIEASELRLRPILMTVSAMIAASVPLVFASGGGAEARFSMGLVIICGLAFGSVVSLFAVPAFYQWFGATLPRRETNPEPSIGAAAAQELPAAP
ncbi:efflux RND transporter permease subunit [Acidiphilium sp.]|uniref:efflux RND transporter permease subunit n=1 Tax=Acidiphilium sp. TaxID=527 RepID=UPI003D070A55